MVALFKTREGDLLCRQEVCLVCFMWIAELLLEDLLGVIFLSLRAELIRLESAATVILRLYGYCVVRADPNFNFIFLWLWVGKIVNYPDTGLSIANLSLSTGISKLKFTTYFDCFLLFLYSSQFILILNRKTHRY